MQLVRAVTNTLFDTKKEMSKCANKTKQKKYGLLRPLRNLSYEQVRKKTWI